MGAWLAVGLGSALGALGRFALSVWLIGLLGPGFPWWTFAVNALGALAIGMLAEVTKPQGPLNLGPHGRPFLLTGLCGGFTTFSIFSLETLILWIDGLPTLAFGYAAGSIAVWIAAVLVGVDVGRRLASAR